jgi:hypothetical protein
LIGSTTILLPGLANKQMQAILVMARKTLKLLVGTKMGV